MNEIVNHTQMTSILNRLAGMAKQADTLDRLVKDIRKALLVFKLASFAWGLIGLKVIASWFLNRP